MAGAEESPKLPAMGPEWFACLREPKTRVAALYELEKAGLEEGKTLQDPGEFAAEHQGTLVFPCPQPGLPSAWMVLNTVSWSQKNARLYGPEPETYDLHPLEVERRRQWEADQANPAPDFHLWQVGQPWFETLSGLLVDPSGKKLDSGFYAGNAVPADFNGDGMLDLLAVEPLCLEDRPDHDSYLDCLSIGPCAVGQLGRVMVYCNERKERTDPKAWRFAVRQGTEGTLQVVLVPSKQGRKEVVFGFREGKFVCLGGRLPKGILMDQNPMGDDWNASRRFLKIQGHKLTGTGSDDVFEVEAGRPCPPAFGTSGEKEWTLPRTEKPDPRAAAQSMARHQFDRYVQQYYEMISVGEPVPVASEGWLERWCQPGWGHEFVAVWWLREGHAEAWKQKDSETFMVANQPAGEVGRRIAITHEIDLVRSVPQNPFAPEDGHERHGGADHNIYRVRAMTGSTLPLTTVFKECTPTLWAMTGARYDRDLASVVAVLANLDENQELGKPQAIREIAPVWLAPEKVAGIPPGLSRAAIHAIGENRWMEMKPLLEKLQTSLDPVSDGEKRLLELAHIIDEEEQRGYGLKGQEDLLSKRNRLGAERELRDLTKRMTGDTRFELRAYVQKALQKLDGTASE